MQRKRMILLERRNKSSYSSSSKRGTMTKKSTYDSYDDEYDDIYMDGDYDYDR